MNVCLAALVGFAVLAVAGPLPSQWLRGTDFFALDSDDMSSNGTFAAIDSAVATVGTGLDLVAVQWMWHMKSVNASIVYENDQTPSMRDIERFIDKAHSSGLKVLLKPMCVPSHSTMYLVDPADPDLWFETYGALLITTATAAERKKVFCLSIAVELLQVAAKYPVKWRALIAQVRAVYGGKLTYGSNPALFEHWLISFWDVLDFVGVDIYIPLATHADPTPTREQMDSRFLSSWTGIVSWWNDTIARHATNPPKLFVPEFGYPSSNQGLIIPWEMTTKSAGCNGNNTGNMTAQAAALSVVYDGIAKSTPIDAFAGIVQFWFGQPGSPDYVGNVGKPGNLWECGWSPAGKNASLAVMRDAYARV